MNRLLPDEQAGLRALCEIVTWRAKHLSVWQTLTSKITQFDYLNSFTDEMVDDTFKSFRHKLVFVTVKDETLMKDVFVFESPYGWLGRLVNFLFLGRYMRRLLIKRNQVIKEATEITD